MAGNGVFAEIIDGDVFKCYADGEWKKSSSGKSVSIINPTTRKVNNTDAEGRLTLADALVYVCNQGVAKIVDLATLTGPCAVALGRSILGVFTPSDELTEKVLAALEVTGEKLRRMPTEVSYWESMKSGVAYMVNTGGPQGGAIAAAIFLKQFATGFGVATLVEWELNNSS